MVLHAHPASTHPAEDEAAEQCFAVSRHASTALVMPVLAQLLVIMHKLLPAQITGMMRSKAERPLRHGQQMRQDLAALRRTSLAGVVPAPIHIGARIGGILQ